MARLDPFVYQNPLVGAMEQARQRREQTRENAARLAKVYSRWTTQGVGTQIVADAFEFSTVFLEEPSFQTGFALVDPAINSEAIELDAADVPFISAGVYRWRQDGRGYYTGAWVFFTVVSTAEYLINHYMSWEGLAMKDIPAHLLED